MHDLRKHQKKQKLTSIFRSQIIDYLQEKGEVIENGNKMLWWAHYVLVIIKSIIIFFFFLGHAMSMQVQRSPTKDWTQASQTLHIGNGES